MPVAIVTGGSRGFGRALALSLAQDGWDVVIDGRDGSSIATTASELEAFGARVRAIPGDIATADHRAEVVRAASVLGRLDLLVNNASSLGPLPLPSLDRYPIDGLRDLFEVNVVAPLALVQLALPFLQETQGTIVSISSDAAIEAYPGWGGYGSSKAALDQLHRVLSVEQPSLRVIEFDPGDMRTDMHRDATPDEDLSDLPLPEAVVPALRRLLDSHSPSGRHRAAEWDQP